jgi:hypothetical protein
MNRCPVCGGTLTGKRCICPLCGNGLNGGVKQEDLGAYPTVNVRMSYRAMDWIISLWGVVALVVLVITRLTIYRNMPYFLMLCLGVICVNVVMMVGIRKWRNLPKSVMYEGVIVALLCIIWDRLTGWHGWSLNFVLPIMGSVLEIFFFSLCLVIRRRRNAYSIYFFLSSVWCGVTFLLAAFDVITYWLPTEIAVITALMLVCAQVLLNGKAFFSELYRRFHV